MDNRIRKYFQTNPIIHATLGRLAWDAVYAEHLGMTELTQACRWNSFYGATLLALELAESELGEPYMLEGVDACEHYIIEARKLLPEREESLLDVVREMGGDMTPRPLSEVLDELGA